MKIIQFGLSNETHDWRFSWFWLDSTNGKNNETVYTFFVYVHWIIMNRKWKPHRVELIELQIIWPAPVDHHVNRRFKFAYFETAASHCPCSTASHLLFVHLNVDDTRKRTVFPFGKHFLIFLSQFPHSNAKQILRSAFYGINYWKDAINILLSSLKLLLRVIALVV